MPRIYCVGFENITIAAAQDLVSCKGSTGKICRLLSAWFGPCNTTLQTAQHLRLNIKLATATITLGSGGAAGVASPNDMGDAAASFTSRTNDTTPATTSGAFTTRYPIGIHNYAGYYRNFLGKGPIFGLNQGIVFELLSTVSGTCVFSGGLEIEEMGL